MIEVQVHVPDSTPVVETIKRRMVQQIKDAHTAAVTADSDEADAVVMFITETYQNLVRLHG